MKQMPLPQNKNIYNTPCPILYAMEIIGQKWKLPILWYIGEQQKLRYGVLKKRVVGITATMLTKCLRELEQDGLITRKQYNTIPPTVEYAMTAKGQKLVEALAPLYTWAAKHQKK